MKIEWTSFLLGFGASGILGSIFFLIYKTRSNIKTAITPLEDDLKAFRQYLERLKIDEAKDRERITANLDQIFKGQTELLKETVGLEKALKGDIKLQGQWGEIVLERILELNDLRAGEHYTTQGKSLSLKNEEGSHQKPDVIIHLPENRHLIIDSKVNLKDYIEYQKEGSEDSLNLFVKNFKSHLQSLSNKNYQKVSLNNPDFVLLFVPMDSMYALLLAQAPDLINRSFENKVVVVSPTSLVSVIKLIHHLWRKVDQNKNAQRIAEMGGSLFDKFSLFYTEMENLGKNLKKSEELYQSINSKLIHGRGNLMDKAQELKKLGVQNTKDLQ